MKRIKYLLTGFFIVCFWPVSAQAEVVDPCDVTTCSGHGTCIAGKTGPRCLCSAGYVLSDTRLECVPEKEVMRRHVKRGTGLITGGGILLLGSTSALIAGFVLQFRIDAYLYLPPHPVGITLIIIGALGICGGSWMLAAGVMDVRLGKSAAISASMSPFIAPIPGGGMVGIGGYF